MEDAFYFLLAVFVLREAVFQVTMHKLINKVMSKNYFDYQTSGNVGAPRPEKIQEEFDEEVNIDTMNDIHPL